MSTTQTVIAAVIVIAAVYVVVFGVRGYLRHRRGRSVRQWAETNRLQYARRDDTWLTRVDWGRPFGIGSSRHAIDVVTGTYRGRKTACFTYQYTTRRPGGGQDEGRHDRNHIGLVSLQLRHPVPELRVAKPLFVQPAPSPADFTTTYQVLGADRAFAEQVLHPEMQQYLLDHDLGGFSMVGDRIFIRTRSQLEPTSMQRHLDVLVAIIELTPDTVRLR
jgi:hypothetical protein